MSRRTLSDSEARWEAIVLISQALDDALAGGAVSYRGESEGWTDADQLAIEHHASARVDGMIRRSGAAERRKKRRQRP